MKKVMKSILFILPALLLVIAGCEKAERLPFYKEGNPVTLAASSTTIAPAIADSDKVALQLNWTSPGYPVEDSADIKYVLELAAAGSQFSDPLTVTLTGAKSASFIGKELNKYATDRQWEFNKPKNMEARVTSSYLNNNDQKVSNTLAFTYTPYLVPPEVKPPAARQLFIVGSATAGGWNNPVPVSQKFQTIDSVTYVGTFYLNGGGQFLLLPVNGDWGHKYSVADGSVPGLSAGGDFGADLSSNIPGPAKTGFYKITVDFQHGKFKVEPAGDYGLLYVPGDYQGWSPATAYALGAPNNDQKFDGYVSVPAGGTYEFKLTKGPNWDNALGDGGGGTLSPSGGNLKFPGAGFYFIQANTSASTFSITPITSVGVIGSFAGSGWGADVPMTYNSSEKRWEATITTAPGDQFKFRMNGMWDLNYGEDGKGGLKQGGDNIGDAGKNYAVPAGTHTVYLYLQNSGYYTYTIL